MGIPVGSFYQKKELGNGTIGSIESNTVNTITAGEDIAFGIALDIKSGQAVKATKAPIFGIAIKRLYVEGDDYDALPDDHWYAGEKIGAVRKGAVAVPITADVNRYDAAAVNADGTFKPAGAGDQIVGRFITDGDANKTAIVQIELTDMGTVAASSPQSAQPTNSAPNSNLQPTDSKAQGGSN